MQHLVAIGNLNTGFQYVGPFEDDIEAESFARKYGGEVVYLSTPQDFVKGEDFAREMFDQIDQLNPKENNLRLIK
jgi:nitrous oxide reductase accessory protein NosL